MRKTTDQNNMGRSHLCKRLLMATALAAITIPAACFTSAPKNALQTQAQSGATTEPPSEKIRLTGTVKAIFQVRASLLSMRHWGVTIRVENVKEGKYSQPEFTFTVHSPANAGLEVGRRCTIEATWTGQGYEVADDRWMRSK